MAASSAAPALLRRLFCSSTPASSSVLRATFCSSAGFGPSPLSSIFGDGTEVANVPPLTTPKLFVSGNVSPPCPAPPNSLHNNYYKESLREHNFTVNFY